MTVYPHYLAHPFRIARDGRTARPADLSQHIKEEVMQLILTSLGERVFQPNIGTNVRRLIFENLHEVTAGVTKSTTTEAISQWMGHRIELDDLRVETTESMISVEVHYRIAGTEDTRVLRFQRSAE